MRKSLLLNIPEPCHEDWNKMTPNKTGRHCHSCSKTVVDFTNLTDEEIIKTYEANDNLCGRFKKQQLDREIVFARKEKNNFRTWAASGLFAFLAIGSQKSLAQTEPVRTVQKDSINSPQIKGKIAHSILNEKTVSGVVTSKSDGLILPGVNVIVKGTSRATLTDFDGKYSLKVKKGETLVFSYIGMETTEIVINTQAKYNVVMPDDNNILGEIVVVGYTTNYNASCASNSLTDAERQIIREKRIIKKENWKAKNKANRLKWKAERLAKKLKRQLERRSKKE